MSAEPDRTPDGDEIDTVTLWLDFPEGEAALSVDLTRWNALRRRMDEWRA